MTTKITITMEQEELQELCHKGTNNALFIAIVEALEGEKLEELEEYFDEWPQYSPIIHANLTLTGDVADSESPNMINFEDRALINRDEARENGWEIDDENGYAYPPESRGE